jgi:NAD(P)-dependent dehydrogenase (short-subunit alcohol dehydrogenase family)
MIVENRFQGRTAIVTGGASGIGLAIAARLSAEGARVSLWDLHEDSLASAKAEARAVHVSALNIADADQVARATEAGMSALDIPERPAFDPYRISRRSPAFPITMDRLHRQEA